MRRQAVLEEPHCTPMQAGQLRKGDYVMIRQRPCKLTQVEASKPGKHGHTKLHLFAQDVFTGKKLETVLPSHERIDCPEICSEVCAAVWGGRTKDTATPAPPRRRRRQ